MAWERCWCWSCSRPAWSPPSTPAKIGVFQALCVAGLGLLGYEVAASLAYGLVLQWVVMLPPLGLWLADLLLGRPG